MDPMESCVPPGFRFHPTEEELVGYYLKRKINSLKIDLDVIVEIDLYKMEPWDIQERCNLGYNEQNEWYFFSHKDKKYPTGTRTNRATAAGFWKATGRDKAVLSKNRIVGMRKTLVFYKGRAPNGRKSDWIMHEYRLQTSEHGPPQEEGWVVCRAFKKPTPNHRQGFEAWNHSCYLRDHSNHNINARPHQSFSDIITSSSTTTNGMYANQGSSFHRSFDSEQAQLMLHSNNNNNLSPMFLDNQLIELPQLDSPTISTSFAAREGLNPSGIGSELDYEDEKYVDWKNLDTLLASRLTDTTSFLLSDPMLGEASCTGPSLEVQNNVGYLLECFPADS